MTRTRGCVSLWAPLVPAGVAVELVEMPGVLLVIATSDTRVQPAVLQMKVPLNGNEFSGLPVV